MINITENVIKFNDLEEKMWKKKMEEGQNELREQLRKIDELLLKNKNNDELEEYLKNNKEGLLRYQYDLGLSQEEIEKLEETEYRNLGTEESQMYCGCRKRMKKNRTSWSNRGAEAMVKVISYIKSNLLEDVITGKMEKEIQRELKEREEKPKKIKKKKLGKIKYATKNSILESLTGVRKQKVIELLKIKGFNEMMIIGN